MQGYKREKSYITTKGYKREKSYIGLRNVKTAISAALCAGLYYLVDRNPTFVCIGAVYGMGNSMGHSWQQGGNRIIGTVIGGVLGVVLFWAYLLIEPEGKWREPLILFVFLGIMILICLSLLLAAPNAIQPGSVVLCIILFNTPVDAYVSYSVNRIIDTTIGVLISMLINYLFPRGCLQKWKDKWHKRKDRT